MKRLKLGALIVVLAGPSAAFVAENRLTVAPSSAEDFSVHWRGLSGAPDFWCAAGDYVVRELNLPPTTRIHRVSGQRGRGEEMRFSLSRAGAQPTGLFKLHGDPLSLSASHARLLCDRFTGLD